MAERLSFVHRKFVNSLKFEIKLPKNIAILVAISGGQDSMCLLKLLKDYQETNSWYIHIMHFDHQWRANSINNSQALKRLSLRWHLPFYLYTQAVYSESSAREWRYSEIIKLATKHHIKYILTAHTIDDKIETALYNLIQGTGFDGITSLNYSNEIFKKVKLIHPLLCLTRKETLWFCKKFYLPIWCDITNYVSNIKRNRIRHELIPYINKYFNPNFNRNFIYCLNIIGKEVNYIKKRTEYFYNICKHPIFIALNKLLLKKLPIVIQRRILRVFLYTTTELKVNFQNTESIIRMFRPCKNNIARLKINKNWYLLFNNNWLYLIKKS
uniref:tRNA(Ile)-lysidine synthase, chloroplastic n=1 Tax=Boldia erythrosiphon TaxID=74908 RepID=A0A1X9PTL1_9RHOD|nr:tRNA(Ile)-lysidine synthase [Boldia erythrosiphon]ARO90659.1 tRNA(Ile)-lysidine synthase [Boldia erythrosiphon]